MKQTMMWAIMALVAIVLMSSFGLHLGSTEVVQIPPSVVGQELYVCPAASNTWDNIANALMQFRQGIMLMFFFVVMLLVAMWGWALYQNLLKDKFDGKAFVSTWGYTKYAFWAGVIMLLLIMTPNHFRTVTLTGAQGNWVLCDNNTPGAKAVRATTVQP